ncbi:DUF339-domain-containing protein [Coprinellus micaceus]|uniref:Succinate dehydrogenase assembly factor 2, mitochondrial n=1 Tax=Coprinellus micaceus TaxID=71717 RepID=A0A4Y7TJB4_COPMI|nr:DUF339-domain-containing protein [Coprinellus micaceus]
MLARVSRRSFITQRQAIRTIAASAVRRADPWPLPHSPEHIAATQTPKDEAKIPPIPRPNETEQSMRARLVYQSRKRGTLETDLLLSTFARDFLSTMSLAEMGEYDKLLDEPDWDIYYWSTNQREAPERWANSPLLAKLRVHVKNEGKDVRKMPEL